MLSARELLERKNMTLQSFKSSDHLFLFGNFAWGCWQFVNMHFGTLQSPNGIFRSFKSRLKVAFYVEIIGLIYWSIWLSRIDVIFRGIQSIIQRCKLIFKNKFAFAIHCAKDKYSPLILLVNGSKHNYNLWIFFVFWFSFVVMNYFFY